MPTHRSYAAHRHEVARMVRRFERVRAGLISEICTAVPGPALLSAMLSFTPFLWAPPLLEFAFTDKTLATWVQRSGSRLSGVELRKPQHSGDVVHVVIAQKTLTRIRSGFSRGQWHPAAGKASGRDLICGALAAAGAITPESVMITPPPAAPTAQLCRALTGADIRHHMTVGDDGALVQIPMQAALAALPTLGLSGSARALAAVVKPTHAAAPAEGADMLCRGAYARRQSVVDAARRPAVEAMRVAALGPLDRYSLDRGLREVAQALVTDQACSYDRCAAALDIPLPMFRRRLSRFWEVIEDKPVASRGRGIRALLDSGQSREPGRGVV